MFYAATVLSNVVTECSHPWHTSHVRLADNVVAWVNKTRIDLPTIGDYRSNFALPLLAAITVQRYQDHACLLPKLRYRGGSGQPPSTTNFCVFRPDKCFKNAYVLRFEEFQVLQVHRKTLCSELLHPMNHCGMLYAWQSPKRYASGQTNICQYFMLVKKQSQKVVWLLTLPTSFTL